MLLGCLVEKHESHGHEPEIESCSGPCQGAEPGAWPEFKMGANMILKVGWVRVDSELCIWLIDCHCWLSFLTESSIIKLKHIFTTYLLVEEASIGFWGPFPRILEDENHILWKIYASKACQYIFLVPFKFLFIKLVTVQENDLCIQPLNALFVWFCEKQIRKPIYI